MHLLNKKMNEAFSINLNYFLINFDKIDIFCTINKLFYFFNFLMLILFLLIQVDLLYKFLLNIS